MVWRTSFSVGGLMMLVTICQMTSSSYLRYKKPEDYAGGYSDSESSSFSIVPWALDVASELQAVECGAPSERRQYLPYHAEGPKHPLTTKAYEHRHSVDVPPQAFKDGRPFSYDYQLQVAKKEPVFVGRSYDYKLEVPPPRTEEPKHSPDCELHVPRPKHQPKKYASKYKVTRLAKRKPEAPLRTYQYHVDVPQRKAKDTRLTGLMAQVDKQLLQRNCGYREAPDRPGDDCANSYLRGSYGSEEFNEEYHNGYTPRGCSDPAYFTNAGRRYHDTECDYHRRSRTKRATNDENADYDPSTKDYFGSIASEDHSVLPHNEKTFIETSMPHTSSYSNSDFDYRGIKLGGTHAYSEEYGSRVENISNSSRLSDTDDLIIKSYISARSPTRDHQHTEHPITSHRLPNYSTRYSRFICRNGHHSACEQNKAVLDERKGRFDHLLQTDNPEHITELPHTTNNPDSFNYTPTFEGKSWVYSVGTQDLSNKGVNVLGTDSLWEEENNNHKVNYALSRYINKIPGTEYRLKESPNPVTVLPGVQPKYDEGAGTLYSVDSSREGMRNKARAGNEVPRTAILEDATGNLKVPGRYVHQKRVGKYDIQNTGHLENQHHYYVQGGTGEDVSDNTNIIPLPPMVHRRIDMVPGYIYPIDNTNNYEEIVFFASPKYHNYETEEQYGRNEDISTNDRSTNRHDVDRWKRSQIKRRSSYVHPTKAYSWQHQQIFPIGTKSAQDSNHEGDSRVMSPCTESLNNRDISLLKLKNKLFGIQLHRNTQYLEDSDKNGGDLLFRNTTEYFPETYNVNHVRNCKYPVFCQRNDYHDDGLDSEAEEGMDSDQSILYSTNAGNNFQADKKLNHQTYRDLTFIRNDKTINANSPLILNAILTSVEKNGEQGTNHQKEHNLKCKRINIGEKHIRECFAAKSDRKYINDQRSKEFLTQEKANIDHHVENLFLPGKYDYVLPLQQNIEHNEGVHNTETWTQYVGNPDIYTKTGFSYGHFNHHRSDRSSSENIDLKDNLQNYQTYGVRGPQYNPQFQNKVGNTLQSVAFSPTEKNSVGAEGKQSHNLPEINEEYFTKSIPNNFSPQGRALERNNGRFPDNTIDKENLIRPNNRIKEEKTTDETYYLPVSYEQAANNLSSDKEQADPSKEVKSLDYRELNKNNQRIGTEDIASKMPVRFDSYAFLKEELHPEIKSKIGLKYNTLNADKGFEISDEALLPEKDIKYSQGYDYNSRSVGMNLDKPKFIINKLGKPEELLSPELSADALQLQIEESMGKMLGKYGHEETNTSSPNNESWNSRNKKIHTGMKLNDHSTEKIYLGKNSMVEYPEANKIELKNKIQLPYDEDKEGRDIIQYNNYHIPNNLKAVKQSQTKMYYDEDMEEDEKGRSKYESYYIQASAAVPTYNKETTALHEGYKQWKLKNGIFGVPHMGGSTRKCSDGCIQEPRDGRVLKATETARHSLLGKFTAFNTERVPDANLDINYSQGPDYNTHSLGTSLGKPKFNINRQEKTEDLSLDLSDDALQLQIEESMSKMLGKNEFTNTNVPSWKNKDWGHMNSKTANDIKLKDYSRERIHTLINPNIDDLKSNQIKFENQIALSCNKRMEEGDKAQYNKANNLNVMKPARTKTYYDEEKQNSNPWYRSNYKKPSVVETTTTSCDKNVKASLIKGLPEAADKSEEYPEQTKEDKEDEWVSVKIHEFPARTHNEYASKRKQKSDNRRTGELEDQTFSGRFYNQRFQPSSKVPLDYKIDKIYPLLGNPNGKERLTAGFESPKAHERCKGFKFPLVAESTVPPPTITNFNADMSYKNNFNLPSHNDGIVGYNEMKHYRHDNYDDDDDYEDNDDDYDHVNDYQEANNAESHLHEDEDYDDSIDKVLFENYHSENFSPNNRHGFYEKFGLKSPEDVTLNDRQTKVSAQKHKGQNIGEYNEYGDDDMIVTHDEELKRFIGGIHYKSQKHNSQTNSPVSKVEKHIWKAKESQSTSPERGSQSSQDELEYKVNGSMENNKPNEYYTSPHIAIKYFPANYHHYEEYYPSEKLNLYQPQGRSQRSPEADPENELDHLDDPELETQIQRPHVLATLSEIQ